VFGLVGRGNSAVACRSKVPTVAPERN